MPDGSTGWDVVSTERISPEQARPAQRKRNTPNGRPGKANSPDGQPRGGGDTLKLALTLPPGMVAAVKELASEQADLRSMVTARLDQMEKHMREWMTGIEAALTAPRTVSFQRGADGMVESATSSIAKGKA